MYITLGFSGDSFLKFVRTRFTIERSTSLEVTRFNNLTKILQEYMPQIIWKFVHKLLLSRDIPLGFRK